MLEQLGTTFTEVLGWIGDVVTQLTTETGALYGLLPLLFIGVGVAIVGVAINTIRKIMWGN